MSGPAPVSTRRLAAEAAAAAAALERASGEVSTELRVLQADVIAKGREIARLHDVCAERQAVIDELRGYGESYRRTAEERAGMIATLEHELAAARAASARAERERDDALGRIEALDREHHLRAEELARAKAETAAHGMEIERLHQALSERQSVIDELREYGESFRHIAEERAGAVAGLEFEVARMRAQIERADAEREQRLQRQAEELETLRSRISELTAAGNERALLIDELTAAGNERALLIGELTATAGARAAVIEQLTATAGARAAMIEQLTNACDERLAAMRRSAAEVESLRAIAEERRVLLEQNEAAYRALEATAREAAEREVPQAQAAAGSGDDRWREELERRDRALAELSAIAERRAVLLAEVTAALEGRTREVDDLRKRLNRAS